MIDMVAISVPFMPEYVHQVGDNAFLDDKFIAEKFALSMEGQIDYENGVPVVSRLRHKFESIPSSFASLAFKFVNGTDFKCYPYIKIVGNPAKLLQGHNVYGSDNLALCIQCIEQAFCFSGLAPIEYLDWAYATVDYLDVTYTAHVESRELALTVLDSLTSIKVGQKKPYCDPKFKTTRYFNKGSRHSQEKIYLKEDELNKQISVLTRKYAATKLNHLRYQLQQITSESVREYAYGAIRLEARVFACKINSLGYSTSFAELREPSYQAANPEIIQSLWLSSFKPILQAFEGATMNAHNHTEVFEALKLAHFRIKKDGSHSYTKANKLFDLFNTITTKGYEHTKRTHDRATWGRRLKEFQAAGLSLAQLMNFTGEVSNVVPLIRFINVDFAKQLPADFVEPLSLREQYQQQPALLRLVS